jgi:hypothetical protein
MDIWFEKSDDRAVAPGETHHSDDELLFDQQQVGRELCNRSGTSDGYHSTDTSMVNTDIILSAKGLRK